MSDAAKAFFRLIVPRIPLLFSTAVLHTLSLTENAKKWDIILDVTIAMLRSIMEKSTSPITRQQKFSLRDPGIQGPMWISKLTLPKPDEDDVRQVLCDVIDELNVLGTETYLKPELIPVEGEWTGHRGGVSNRARQPAISEDEKYQRLVKEVTSDVTVLYFHGGAYYMMDPCSHRLATARLAKETRGRVFSVRYRLAPQHPFPAAVLDCLIAYLSVLYPPPGSPHAAAKPENIIFAGDSAGGNMALVLALAILQFNRKRKTLKFNGNEVELPVPGGVSGNSPWCDVLRSLPSLTANHKYDYLPLPHYAVDHSSDPPTQDPVNRYPCPLWPASPQRADLYCDGPALAHPLVSPLSAPVELWQGMPPTYISMGEEMIADEGRVVASRIVRAGGKVRWEGYEAMPHCFAMAFKWLPQAKRNYDGWSGFMNDVVSGKFRTPADGAIVNGTAEEETGSFEGTWIRTRTVKEEPVKFEELTDLTDEKVEELMKKELARRLEVFKKLQDALAKQGQAGEKAKL